MKCFTLLILAAECLAAQNYPPAQGPPLPSPSGAPQGLAIRSLVDQQVRIAVDQKLNAPWDGVSPKSINLQLASRSDVHAFVTATSFTTPQPYITQTANLDKPNSRYLLIPYTIGFTVSQIYFHTSLGWINYPWDRNIEVSAEIRVFCDHWETGVGRVLVVPKVSPPILDSDPSFSEQVVNFFLGNWLIPLVDSNVRQGLSSISVDPIQTPLSCNCLDYIPGDVNDLNQGVLMYKQKPNLVASGLAMTVKLVEVKRLVARDLNHNPVYSPTENPELSLYANLASAVKALPPIAEGQTVSLAAMRALSVPWPGFGGNLTLIASLTQHDNSSEEDSSFVVFPLTPNFAGGRQSIQIWKTYWETPSVPRGSKPTKRTVEGYEITVDISVPAVQTHK